MYNVTEFAQVSMHCKRRLQPKEESASVRTSCMSVHPCASMDGDVQLYVALDRNFPLYNAQHNKSNQRERRQRQSERSDPSRTVQSFRPPVILRYVERRDPDSHIREKIWQFCHWNPGCNVIDTRFKIWRRRVSER